MPSSASQFGRSYDLDDDALSDDEDDRKKQSKKDVNPNPSKSTNPMDAEVNGTPFSVLMQQAVKMKTAQSEPFKRTFESWPRFYQNSVFSKEDIVSLREKGDFGELMARAKEIKEDANKKVTSSNGNEVMEANHLYEQALSLFKWATNDDPKWKEKGMRDESISEHIYDCKSLKEREEVQNFMKSVYLNIGLACQRTGDHDVCIQACDAALELDSHSSKALYRRAMSRIAPKSAGGVEYEKALSDLTLANKHNPEDRNILTQLRKLRGDLKQQQKNDKKTFTGMFERGEIYLADNEKQILDRVEKSSGEVNNDDKEDTIERRIYEARQLYSVYMKQERFKEAEELMTKIDATKEAHKRMQEREKSGKGAFDLEDMDFNNPTPQMIKDAAERDIDLTDPRVIEMLVRLKEEKHKKASGEIPEDAAASSGPEQFNQKYSEETRAKLDEMVGDMPSKDLASALTEMEIKFDSSGTNEYLKGEFITALMAGHKIPDTLKSVHDTGSQNWFIKTFLKVFGGGSTSIWGNIRVAVIFVLISIGYRMIFGAGRGGGVQLQERRQVVEEIVHTYDSPVGAAINYDGDEEF